MLLSEQLNFIKVKNKYEKSIKKNQEQLKNEILGVKIRQSFKDLNNFAKAIEMIK